LDNPRVSSMPLPSPSNSAPVVVSDMQPP
jgi:hypothetical protein